MDLVCAICEKIFPENAAGSYITTVGSVCPKCVAYLQKSVDGSEGPGDGGV